MNEKLKMFLKLHWKPVAGVMILGVIVSGILIVHNLDSKKNPVDIASDTGGREAISTEDSEVTEAPAVEETPQVEETKELIPETSEDTEEIPMATVAPTAKADDAPTEKPKVTKNTDTNSEEKDTTSNTDVVKPTKKPDSQSETVATEAPTAKAPTTEVKYVPISEGWKAEASAKGDITSAQKADLDSLIQTWKSGALTDSELKVKIISYLEEQNIDYMEVSVTSKGYALFEKVPEIDLRDGGNLYSFVGTYSTGKQNPDGTNKTVCYNWSAFVF